MTAEEYESSELFQLKLKTKYANGYQDGLAQKEQKQDPLVYDEDLDHAAKEFYLSGKADVIVDSTVLVLIVRMAEFGATWMKKKMEKEQKPAEVCYGPKGDPDPAGQMDEIGRLIFRYFRKVLASFGVYAEDEILPVSKEETLCYYSQLCAEAILKSLRPQPKQEWSEEDEANFAWFDKFFRAESIMSGGKDIPQDKYLWFKSLHPQPKEEWSKEDEDKLYQIIETLLADKEVARQENPQHYDALCKAYDELITWLKSLPLNLKKKNDDIAKLCSNEWSEEDEEMLEYIIGDVNDAVQLYATKSAKDMAAQEIDWLKSLPMRCPKSSDNWKPSEEQMEQNHIRKDAILKMIKERLKLYDPDNPEEETVCYELQSIISWLDGKGKRRLIRHEESQTQRQCVAWFRLQYPENAKLLFAVPNGGGRSRVEAAIMKAEGVTAGVSDLILLEPRGGYGALCIEMKTGSKSSRQSDSQKEWQKAVEAAGNVYAIAKSFDDFVAIMNSYMRLKKYL